MDRCHDGFLDADPASDDLDDRGDTVGRAACTGEDARVPIHCIDPMDNRDNIIALGRRGEDYILGSGLNVFFKLLPFRKHARTLQHDIHPQVGPGKTGWIFLTEEADGFSRDDQAFFIRFHGLFISTIHGIVL